jgi:quercetin dioxygenase-like cupin family protein
MITLNPKFQVNYDGASIYIYHANKNEGLPKHDHVYNHLTMCHAGSCLVSLENGKSIVINKDTQPVNLKGNIKHEIEALEDNTVFVNVFAEGKY